MICASIRKGIYQGSLISSGKALSLCVNLVLSRLHNNKHLSVST
jgi:hypothetical protein